MTEATEQSAADEISPLLRQAAKDREAIEALPPDQRSLLDMQMAHLKRETERMWRCIEAGRTSSQ